MAKQNWKIGSRVQDDGPFRCGHCEMFYRRGYAWKHNGGSDHCLVCTKCKQAFLANAELEARYLGTAKPKNGATKKRHNVTLDPELVAQVREHLDLSLSQAIEFGLTVLLIEVGKDPCHLLRKKAKLG